METFRKSADRFTKIVEFSGIGSGLISQIISIIATLVATIVLVILAPSNFPTEVATQIVPLLVIYATITSALSIFFLQRTMSTRDDILLDAQKLINIREDLKNQDDILKRLEGIAHEAAKNSRRVALRVRGMSDASKKSDNSYKSDEIFKRVISNWRKFSQLYADNSREIFQMLTNSNCSVCIKILGWPTEDGREPTIETLIRDNVSKRLRDYVDKNNSVYSASSNTAFNRIMHDQTFDTEFSCNDLSRSPTYLNVNEDWRDFYNSTLVCPIGSELYEIDKIGHDEPIGYDLIAFLCIDSLNADLESKRCISIGKILANIYNEYLNYVARAFFELYDEGKLDEISTSKDIVDYKSFEAMVEKISNLKYENRPIGIKISREPTSAHSKKSGTYFEKTPMIIYRLYKEWKGSSLA